MARTGVWNAFSANAMSAEMNEKNGAPPISCRQKEASVWHDTFLQWLAEAKATKHGTSIDHGWKQLTRVVGQKTQARNAKRMLKMLGNPSTTKL
jgi:hypothetical protein